MFGAEDQNFVTGQPRVALPIELEAIARVVARWSIRARGRGVEIAVSHSPRLLEMAVEQRQMRRSARVILARVVCALRGIRGPRKSSEVLASVAQMRIGVAADQAEVEDVAEVQSQLRRCGEIVVVVIDTLLARREQVQRRYRSRARMKVFDIRRVMKSIGRPCQARGLIEGGEGTALDAGNETRRPRPALRDDVDHPADRVRAVKPALRTAQDLDLREVLSEQLAELERCVGACRINHVD